MPRLQSKPVNTVGYCSQTSWLLHTEGHTNSCNGIFTGDEDFLILACDGLWDVIKPVEAVDLVIQLLAEGGERSSVAKLLVDSAKTGGSNDNISVVVVFLDSHKKDVPSEDMCDNVASTDMQHVDNVMNSTESGTSQNINSENTTSPELSPNLPKSSSEASPNPEDGNTLEEQDSASSTAAT